MALSFGLSLISEAITAGGASLVLPFAGATALDSRITFTRGSNATMVGSNGLIQYAPNNLLTYSQEFDNAAWTSSATVVANAAIAPDGTLTADSITPSANDQTSYQLASTGSVIGRTFSLSVWLKADISHTATIRMYDNFAAESFSSNVTVTQVWQRFSLTATWTTGTGNLVSMIYPKLMGSGAANLTVYAWGAQLNVGALQPYYPTTSAAYYGPRLVYDPATLAAQGLLVEEQRTNLLLYSEQFDNAYWNKSSSTTISANTTTAPDGILTADTFAVTVPQDGFYNVSPAASINTAYTSTIYAKANSISSLKFGITNQNESQVAYYLFDLTNGSVSLDTNYVFTNTSATCVLQNNGWYKCTVSATTPSTGITNIGIFPRLIAAGSVYLWGAQLEAGAFATSYIPTTTAQATRAADVATMTGTNFSSWYNQTEGTLCVESSPAALGNTAIASITNGTTANRMSLQCTSANAVAFRFVSASGNFTSTAISYSANTSVKAAYSYKTLDQAAAVNGTIALGITSQATIPTVTQLQIGLAPAVLPINGTIKSITYYPRRLANTELQALTS